MKSISLKNGNFYCFFLTAIFSYWRLAPFSTSLNQTYRLKTTKYRSFDTKRNCHIYSKIDHLCQNLFLEPLAFPFNSFPYVSRTTFLQFYSNCTNDHLSKKRVSIFEPSYVIGKLNGNPQLISASSLVNTLNNSWE